MTNTAPRLAVLFALLSPLVPGLFAGPIDGIVLKIRPADGSRTKLVYETQGQSTSRFLLSMRWLRAAHEQEPQAALVLQIAADVAAERVERLVDRAYTSGFPRLRVEGDSDATTAVRGYANRTRPIALRPEAGREPLIEHLAKVGAERPDAPVVFVVAAGLRTQDLAWSAGAPAEALGGRKVSPMFEAALDFRWSSLDGTSRILDVDYDGRITVGSEVLLDPETDGLVDDPYWKVGKWLAESVAGLPTMKPSGLPVRVCCGLIPSSRVRATRRGDDATSLPIR
ncbi:MAG: hypothetical protein GY711_16665 [bacterium]|nr:hypothetical protein [bacterium]